MTFRRAAFTVALLALTGPAVLAAAPQAFRIGPTPTTDPRLAQLETWLTAVFEHQPGELDAGVETVGEWSNEALRTLTTDIGVIVQLIRYPARTSPFSVKVEGLSSRQSVHYSPSQFLRLKQLACVAGGGIGEPSCAPIISQEDLDPTLQTISDRARAAKRAGDDNLMLRLGALFHADVVMLGLAVPADSASHPRPIAMQSVKVMIADGQQTSLEDSGAHWELARMLMDEVRPAGSPRAAPGRDPMVRLWYRATAAWMQLVEHHDNTHLDRGRAIFPDDEVLAFLTGGQHEAYGAPAIQSAVRTAVLPTGVTMAVGPERAELRDAERFFRRAIEINPRFTEAHLHLGRVLALTGRDADAATELHAALASTDEKVLVYFGSLFLGGVEENLGHPDAARTAYERAAALFPQAQSPRLGLSEVARRAGNREAAFAEIRHVFELPRDLDDDADPWWDYHLTVGRHTSAMLDELRQPFLLKDQP